MNVYVAHPITGSTRDQVLGYYARIQAALIPNGFTVYWPMIAKGPLKPETTYKSTGYDAFPQSTNHAIRNRDRFMVKHCDILYLDLTGTTTVSIGCVMELAWASDAGKHIVVIMAKENIHRHAFVLECSDIIFETEAEALVYMERFGKRIAE